MQKMCWKITRNGFSWSISLGEGFILSYELGKLTTPKIGRIFCLPTIEDTIKYLLGSTHYGNPKKLARYPIVFYGIGDTPSIPKKLAKYGKVAEYWQYINKKKKVPDDIAVECYTGICKTITVHSFLPKQRFFIPNFFDEKILREIFYK